MEFKIKPRNIGAVCVCGRRHTREELLALPEWGHHDAPEHIIEARRIARRLIRHARANGCQRIHIWSEGDRLEESQRENDLVIAMCHVVDDCTVEFLGEVVELDDGKRRRLPLSRALWIPENGRDSLSDWLVTGWAERALDTFIDQLIEEEQKQ